MMYATSTVPFLTVVTWIVAGMAADRVTLAAEPVSIGGPPRIWTDESGRRSVPLTLLNVDREYGLVTLGAGDGRRCCLPIAQLSDEDERLVLDSMNDRDRLDTACDSPISDALRSQPPFRVWTNQDGRKSPAMAVMRVDAPSGIVFFRGATGQRYSCRIIDLARQDLQWLVTTEQVAGEVHLNGGVGKLSTEVWKWLASCVLPRPEVVNASDATDAATVESEANRSPRLQFVSTLRTSGVQADDPGSSASLSQLFDGANSEAEESGIASGSAKELLNERIRTLLEEREKLVEQQRRLGRTVDEDSNQELLVLNRLDLVVTSAELQLATILFGEAEAARSMPSEEAIQRVQDAQKRLGRLDINVLGETDLRTYRDLVALDREVMRLWLVLLQSRLQQLERDPNQPGVMPNSTIGYATIVPCAPYPPCRVRCFSWRWGCVY